MQIRCSTCTKTIQVAPTGALPAVCPHGKHPAFPATIGDFALDRLVATGGMGEVYLAHHRELGTPVAIKLLPAMPLDTIPALRDRFAREARLTAKVQDQGVVRVLHSDVTGDRPYLVLEFVSGQTLRRRLADGPLPVVEAARIAAATADVLASAHREGVLHRDIKPDNVMLDEHVRVRVLDFGIARAIADDEPLTRTGEIVGTPEYMAPEQLLDGPAATSERTDVHALGLLLYELLTARSPFRGANLFQSLKLVESFTPGPPSASLADGSLELDAVIATALEKRPEDRIATAALFAAAVRTAVPAARGGAEPAVSPRRRSARVATTLAILGCACALLLWLRPPAATHDDRSGLARASSTPSAEQLAEARRAEIHADLREGAWSRALTRSIAGIGNGEHALRPLAREAFVLSHALWPLVADQPAWLGAIDLGRRNVLFGDSRENVHEPDNEQRQRLHGDLAAWNAWLDSPAHADSAAAALLNTRHGDIVTRAAALAAWATRTPIDRPEHWLARTIERHLRGETTLAHQAAEMAWLSGAGETAVLLDAALTALADAAPPMNESAARSLARRVAATDRADNPANVLLVAYLDATHALALGSNVRACDALPPTQQVNAAAWFVDRAARSVPRVATALLQRATELGAVPDFALEPWRSTPIEHRAALRVETPDDR